MKWNFAKTVAVSPTSSLVSQTDAEGGLASNLKKKQFRKGRSKSFFLTYQFIERTVAVISFSVRAIAVTAVLNGGSSGGGGAR